MFKKFREKKEMTLGQKIKRHKRRKVIKKWTLIALLFLIPISLMAGSQYLIMTNLYAPTAKCSSLNEGLGMVVEDKGELKFLACLGGKKTDITEKLKGPKGDAGEAGAPGPAGAAAPSKAIARATADDDEEDQDNADEAAVETSSAPPVIQQKKLEKTSHDAKIIKVLGHDMKVLKTDSN